MRTNIVVGIYEVPRFGTIASNKRYRNIQQYHIPATCDIRSGMKISPIAPFRQRNSPVSVRPWIVGLMVVDISCLPGVHPVELLAQTLVNPMAAPRRSRLGASSGFSAHALHRP
jgi:hypothetical protein